MNPENTTSSTPDLAKFSSLPPDIRQEIWRAASSQPISTPSVCILTFARPSPNATSRVTTHAPLIVHEPPNPTLLSTNTEAHDIALTTSATRPYNPSIDILYISKPVFIYFTNVLCGRNTTNSWTSSIRHLALDLAVSDMGLWLPIAMERLPSLEILSVVYPATSGTFSCFQTVEVPTVVDSKTVLRSMSDEERERVMITAEYNYETHGGDIEIEWVKDVNEHLEMVEEELCGGTNPSWRSRNVPIWDSEEERLRLRYQGRVFDQLERKSYHGRG
ncbi:hypothetical protein OQA88_6677 [Cercophora sp. LCS_1]